jgi:DNA-binding LytR/AlgR family response regulator
MIKAIAIDDEPLSLKIIEKFCAKSDLVSLQESFTQTTEATRFLEQNDIDLLFLDINMPAISGIDFYKSLPNSPMLIFTTAYTEFALEGFNLSAVDYLVKPFTYDRFEKAIQKAKEYYQHIKPREVNTDKFILVKSDYSLIKIFLKDILFIEVLDNYLKIHLDDTRTIVTRMPMKTILDKLPSEDFIRVHRSFVVPFSKIKSVRNKVINIGTEQIPIGSSYEAGFFSQFKD